MAARKPAGGEDLEVAVDFGVELGTVDDGVGGGFHRHFFNGERISQNEIATVHEFVDDLWNDRAQRAEAGLVLLWVDFDKFGKVAVGTLPEE